MKPGPTMVTQVKAEAGGNRLRNKELLMAGALAEDDMLGFLRIAITFHTVTMDHSRRQ